jgi:HK97 family phage prohead protease
VKYTTGYIEKAASAEFDARFVMSEESPDRVGDVIDAKGWQLEEFKRNPVALWMHEHDKPIGKWANVQVRGKQLIGDLKLATTNLGQMAKKLLEEDILRAVSVGFRPIDYDPIDKDDPWGAWHIKSANLLECSLCAVPAHQNALRIAKSLGLDRAERELIFGASSVAVEIDPDVRGIATNPAVLKATHALEMARKTLER